MFSGHHRKLSALIAVVLVSIGVILREFRSHSSIQSTSTSSTSLKTTNHETTSRAGNPHDFQYVFNNEALCGSEVLTYLVFFHSRPSSRKSRDILRETWAQPNLFLNHPSRLVFLLGIPYDRRAFDEVRDESAQYGDIVMEDFIDSYNNMTYNAIGGLKWVTHFCPNVKYIIKSNEDIYFNIFRLITLLETEYINHSRFFLCLLCNGTTPIFKNTHVAENCMEWCVPTNVLPGQRFFPPYCSGSAYVFTADIAAELYNASFYTPSWFIGDVYITGLLVQKVRNIRHIQWKEGTYITAGPNRSFFSTDTNATRHVMVVHDKDLGWYWEQHLLRLPREQMSLIGPTKYHHIMELIKQASA